MLILLLLAASPALAFRLPDWARAIADSAPPVGEVAASQPHRILLLETRVVVGVDGTLKIRRRVATQALRTDADEIGWGYFAFSKDAKITESSAWHLAPGKTAQTNWMAPVDLALEDGFLTSSRRRYLRVEGIRRGSLVFFEFDAVDTPSILAWHQDFDERVETLVSRYELEAPEGWTVKRPGCGPRQ